MTNPEIPPLALSRARSSTSETNNSSPRLLMQISLDSPTRSAYLSLGSPKALRSPRKCESCSLSTTECYTIKKHDGIVIYRCEACTTKRMCGLPRSQSMK